MMGNPPQNALEPAGLCELFIRHPPEGFEARWLETGGTHWPVFVTPFELLTTLDDAITPVVRRHPIATAGLLSTVFGATVASSIALDKTGSMGP